MGVCVFVYGTLMDPEIMEEASGCLPRGVDAVLAGFGRYRVGGEQYPGIKPEPGTRVEGVLYYDVGENAVERLDVFEGDMYSREVVRVTPQGSAVEVEAMVYLVKPAYRSLLSSAPWSFEEFSKSGKRLFTSGYRGFDDVGSGI